MIKNCKICKKEFKIAPSRILDGKGKYCSKECFYKGKITRFKKFCEICGKEIEVKPSQIKNNEGRFCSIKCKNIFQSVSQKGRILGLETKQKIKMKAIGRKHSFETIQKMRLSNSNRKHSEETKKKIGIGQVLAIKEGRRIISVGDKNPNWKGGLTVIIRGMRRSFEYSQWRKDVLRRDNNTCQRCMKINVRIVHHIKEFSKYPDVRFDRNNGITLCEYCHKKEHFSSNK